MRPDARGLRQLTYRNGSDAAWSPHAGKLIFVRGQAHGLAWRYDLFVVRADRHSLRRLSTPGADYPDAPGWSPDGKLIGYHAFDSGVWVQRPDGSGVRRVAPGASGATYHVDALEPDWQPLPRD